LFNKLSMFNIFRRITGFLEHRDKSLDITFIKVSFRKTFYKNTSGTNEFIWVLQFH
jgi:hypothetical protein